MSSGSDSVSPTLLLFCSVSDVSRSQIRIEAVKMISSNRSSGDVIAFGVITVKNSFFDLFEAGEPIDVVFKSRVSHS